MTAAIAVVGLVVSPAIGASGHATPQKRAVSLTNTGYGTFTPASADPLLAAAFARSGVTSSGFRFTPTSTSGRPSRAVTVAVRARAAVTPITMDRPVAPPVALNLAPVTYNLGVALGWKRFALSGDVAQADLGGLQGGRRSMDVGVSYATKKWSSRVQLAADKPVGAAPRTINGTESVSVDFGGSYRLTRNLDVTAGVRYKSERDRLEPLADNRRDSQAVYVGTAFKF
jgi:Gram-negative porin